MGVRSAESGGAIGALLRVQRTPAIYFSDDVLRSGPQKLAAARQRKMILLAIASYADPDGTNAYMSRNTLSRETGFSPRAVSLAIDWLTEQNILSVEFKKGTPGAGVKTNRYAINFSLLTWDDVAIRLQRDSSGDVAVSDADVAGSGEDVALLQADVAIRVQPTALINRPYKSPINTNTPRVDLDGLRIKARQSSEWLEDEITSLTDGQVAFDRKQMASLCSTMIDNKYLKEEMLAGFKIWWAQYEIDLPGAKSHAARKYVDAARTCAATARRKKQERQAEQARMDAGLQRLQEEAAREWEEHLRRKAEEEAMVEDELSAD